MLLTNIPKWDISFEMIAAILADFSDVAQTPHPIFGVPLGVGLLIVALYKLFKSNDSPSNSIYTQKILCPTCLGKGSIRDDLKCSRCDGMGLIEGKVNLSPPIDTTKYGEHEFNKNGFCSKCGWERDFLVRMNQSKCGTMKVN
jgi:hypothetical protein